MKNIIFAALLSLGSFASAEGCLDNVRHSSDKIKADASSIIKTYDDELKEQIAKYGESSMGMSALTQYENATQIKNAVVFLKRNLDLDASAIAILESLCTNKLDVRTTVENY